MAKALNKNRMLYSGIILFFIFFLGILANIDLERGEISHEFMETLGYILIIICAFGRVYSTAFIGGIKNEKLVTWGPYSLCRNPLYFFSYVGVVGIAFASTSWLAVLVAALGVYFLYDQLIRREEIFLAEKFGDTFSEYKTRVPRLFPSLRSFNCPDELVFQPRYLFNSIADSVWWFLPLPLFEAIENLNLHINMGLFLSSILGL